MPQEQQDRALLSAPSCANTVRRMVEPDDFGCTPLATLARVADVSRSARHATFWKNWMSAVFAHEPRLRSREDPDVSDSTATHEFESANHVRIGCTLHLPKGRPMAGLVALHGYEGVPLLEESATRWRSHIEKGTAVLCLRVRGYPGSQADVQLLAQHCGHARGGGEWITWGLEVPLSENGYGCAWALSYACADVVNSCRAFRALLDRQSTACPIYMHGESFGAALAIIASAQLMERFPRAAPARLAIGVPTLGEWAWRLARRDPASRRSCSAGGILLRYISEHPWLENQIVETLHLFDTAVHARRINCPVLCKLALLDDVVPAPTAAAVFNALSTDPGLKYRYITRYGHFDGGISDLRRHAAFERLVDRFLDPATDPISAAMGRDEGLSRPSAAPGHAPPGVP